LTGKIPFFESVAGRQPLRATSILPKLLPYRRLKIFAILPPLARWKVLGCSNFGNMPNVVCNARTKREARK
jgi:hypothetical protein